jgi:hypothetical protein
MAKILFLAANPSDTPRKRLGEEIRTIDERLRLSELRDLFEIAQHWAVRISDLQSYLLRHEPDIVHFSGYGSSASEILLEDRSGKSKPVGIAPLSELFSILKDNLRCVVLNACYSERQARAITKHIECVIGMPKEISQSAAISFVASFYQALGYGKSIRTAFALGCNQMLMEGFSKAAMPRLETRNADAGDLIFVHARALDANQLNILMKLGTGGSGHRIEAARQLGHLKEPAAIPILVRRWPQEPDATVKYWLAIALGEIGGQQAAQALHRLRDGATDPYALWGIDDALDEIEKKGGDD